ncbi:histidine phosphatase family protein [Massilia psychrophila]|uniref:Histidine phosphatase family protein n=1 Tax=Massilia psychrophila TaxID=1603353 RepID=A0A2G8SWK1_9BURK|nr:histidine phosphatase family protein [Massilia psychrophila]PIL38144.1 hypothetical protein CR103_19605 [Massilia psychrophila]GGE86080.1 phosphoglycerate mutase [Massilia psychrophila]
MNPVTRFIAALSLALAMLAPSIALAAPAAIYLVRHGEKETGGAKDPELTERGQVRARNIAAILHKVGVKAVFSTPLKRTRQTVGHSNTLTELVRLFGGMSGPDIANHEYDRLYQLTVDSAGAITTVLLTSVPATRPVP